MSRGILILSCRLAILFVMVTAGSSDAQIQSSENPMMPTAIKEVASQPVSGAGEVASVITPPSSPQAISVVATVLGAAGGTSGPIAKNGCATAPFNNTVTIPPGMTSMTIYCLNPPTGVGLATVNLSISSPIKCDVYVGPPIYMDFNLVTITSDMPSVSFWLTPGTYNGLLVYNHNTDSEWNPGFFYITWQ